MKKLHIGKEVDQLSQLQKIIENKVERDMVIRDLIVNLYPVLGGENKENSLIITDTVLKIRNCKDGWIELENHDYDTLKSALLNANLLVWVKTALIRVFEETDVPNRKKTEDG